MSEQNKVVVTCALTGLLTDPAKFNVPVTPKEMADAAEQSHNAGASVLHCHFRDQREGMGAFLDKRAPSFAPLDQPEGDSQ